LVDYGFKKGFLLSKHAADRLEERTSFTVIQLLKILHKKLFAKLSLQKKLNIPRSELDFLINDTGLTFRELAINSIVTFDTFSYLLIWSREEDKYFIAILKELSDIWLVLTILPSSYLNRYYQDDHVNKHKKAKNRMLNQGAKEPDNPIFKRYSITAVWNGEDVRTNVKTRKLKSPIESYSLPTDFINIGMEITDGIQPDWIIVRSCKDINDVFIELNCKYSNFK
jgi:hypothetical protein